MEKIIIALLVALAFYWLLGARKKSKKDDFMDYYNTIINSDKYKVKGKFETK
ncbi:MAG: hypothetical protein ACOCQX_02870 [Candidatus Nanoarchaeia archaeon]